VVSLAVGFPLDAESQPTSDRLPVGHLLHIEEYVDYTSEDIDNCYAYKESLPESAKFISENNKETLAQVFTDVRYPENNNTIFSDIYYRFIEEKGFKFPK
ncbi:MAG: NADPH-dependent oxidoreductase, partial [Muribaculaceae bacterium]